MPRILRGFCGGVVGAVAACLAAPAGAALWHSGFDPVTFSGNALFQFADACLAASTSTASSCNLTLLSATVNLNSPGGSSAVLTFGPQVIQGLPGIHVAPGEIFTFQLTEVGGATPGATRLINVTVGSPLGGGMFSVDSISVPDNSTITLDVTNLEFDGNNLALSGSLTGTFFGQHGGLHNIDATFGPGNAWTIADTKNGMTTTTAGSDDTVPILDVNGGTLLGIDSSLIGPAFVTDPSSPLFGPWWIQWQTEAGAGGSIADSVLLFTGSCGSLSCADQSSPSGIAANVIFSSVPEPTTLALLGASLAGLGFSRRSRKR